MSVAMQILEELKKLNAPKLARDRLWDSQFIADYLGLKKSTVQSHIVCKPDFPKAIRINGTRRWKPDEVIAWADKSREKAA